MSAPDIAGGDERDIPLALINFQLPPPRALSEDERGSALISVVTRIQNGAEESKTVNDVPGQKGLPASDMWMLLLVRMVTRAPVSDDNLDGEEDAGKKEEARRTEDCRNDETRRTLCNYVLGDFPSRLVPLKNIFASLLTGSFFRVRLATVWMNEEWYNDRIRSKQKRGWVSSASSQQTMTIADI